MIPACSPPLILTLFPRMGIVDITYCLRGSESSYQYRGVYLGIILGIYSPTLPLAPVRLGVGGGCAQDQCNEIDFSGLGGFRLEGNRNNNNKEKSKSE